MKILKHALILALVLMLRSANIYGQIEIFSDQISLGSALNSQGDELNIVLSPDGGSIFFTRSNHPQNIGGLEDPGDIWVSNKMASGGWTAAQNIRSINDSGNNRIIGFMDGGRAMLVHSEEGFGFSYNASGKWLKPTAFKIPYFKSLSDELSGSISADGRYLLFGMESFGSYGVEDIYMCRLKRDGNWTSPKNLGRSVNSSNQEITPFIAADNKTLFFASNGRGGEGSFDIFMSTRLDDTWQKWSEPVNLGDQVNTNGWERSFVFRADGELAYLASTQNSDGYGDLKKVKMKPDIEPEIIEEDTAAVIDITEEKRIITFKGTVKDNLTKKSIVGAEVTVTTEPANIQYQVLSNSDGGFNLNIEEGNSYVVKVKAFRYMSAENVVEDAVLLQSDIQTYYLEPLIEGNTVTLDHVLFEQGKAILVQGSEKELDLVVEMMVYNPDITIFLSGHTDNRGQSALNIQLSEDRVVVVEDYLVSKGIDKKRVSGKGYGGTRPIASNANPESRKMNRRVEFTVHEKGK